MSIINQTAKSALAIAMLATVVVPTAAEARCFVKWNGGKRFFEDGNCSQTTLPCVDFITAPKDGQFPIEMVPNRKGVRIAMIKGTDIACTEAGTLTRRGPVTTCAIPMGTPREWAEINKRGGGVKDAGF